MRIPPYSNTQAITTNEANTPAAPNPTPSAAAAPATLAEDSVQLSSASQLAPQQNDNETTSINGTAKGNDRPPV